MTSKVSGVPAGAMGLHLRASRAAQVLESTLGAGLRFRGSHSAQAMWSAIAGLREQAMRGGGSTERLRRSADANGCDVLVCVCGNSASLPVLPDAKCYM